MFNNEGSANSVKNSLVRIRYTHANTHTYALHSGAVAFGSAAFGAGNGAILLDDVQCSGIEPKLLPCPNNGVGVHNCSHSQDAGVRCQSQSTHLNDVQTHIVSCPFF